MEVKLSGSLRALWEHNKPYHSLGTETGVAEIKWGGNLERKEEPLLTVKQAQVLAIVSSPGAHSPGMYPLC